MKVFKSPPKFLDMGVSGKVPPKLRIFGGVGEIAVFKSSEMKCSCKVMRARYFEAPEGV